MKRHERDLELIDVILEDCDTVARRISYFKTTETSFVADYSLLGDWDCIRSMDDDITTEMGA